jgi:hypothetical protein
MAPMNANAEPSPTLTAPPLWERARAMFGRALAAIGDPAAIAAIALLTHALRRDIIRRLAPLEHVVRKLLLAEAAALHRQAQDAARAAAARGPRMQIIELRSLGLAMHAPIEARSSLSPRGEGTGRGVNPAAAVQAQTTARADLGPPNTWRVSFSFAIPRDPDLPNSRAPRIRALWGGDAKPRAHETRAPMPQQRTDSALLLARRFEAVRRVLHDPLPYARRLTQLLLRKRRSFAKVIQRYLFAPARTGDYDPDDDRLGMHAFGSARDATEAAFSDTS